MCEAQCSSAAIMCAGINTMTDIKALVKGIPDQMENNEVAMVEMEWSWMKTVVTNKPLWEDGLLSMNVAN